MSFEEFVAGSSARLFRTALLLSGNDRAAAEDLLQLALERTYRHWARVCRSGAPERYVHRILANAANDRWRRAARRRETPLGLDTSAALVSADHAALVAERDFLIRALAALPPRQRTVLVLRYFDDLPEGEIADVLSCSVGTVKSQVSRGLARLREMTEPGAEVPSAPAWRRLLS